MAWRAVASCLSVFAGKSRNSDLPFDRISAEQLLPCWHLDWLPLVAASVLYCVAYKRPFSLADQGCLCLSLAERIPRSFHDWSRPWRVPSGKWLARARPAGARRLVVKGEGSADDHGTPADKGGAQPFAPRFTRSHHALRHGDVRGEPRLPPKHAIHWGTRPLAEEERGAAPFPVLSILVRQVFQLARTHDKHEGRGQQAGH